MTSDTEARRSRIRGCLFGGAIGDALGAPTEFLSLSTIRSRWPPDGVTGFEPKYGRHGGAITDDTQMTLFTAEAMIEAARDELDDDATIEATRRAYQRWFTTQFGAFDPDVEAEGLLAIGRLWAGRAPGTTCLGALQADEGVAAQNDSKGCGGVMRVAPVGLVRSDAFDLGCRTAAITHGHPTGQIAAGAFAVMIAAAMAGAAVAEAVQQGRSAAATHPDGAETVTAIDHAIASTGEPVAPETLQRVGEGWIGEEALAVAVWCVLVEPEVERALLLAVNHSGDTDSTGSLVGQLLGAVHGVDALPEKWRADVELADVLINISERLVGAEL